MKVGFANFQEGLLKKNWFETKNTLMDGEHLIIMLYPHHVFFEQVTLKEQSIGLDLLLELAEFANS